MRITRSIQAKITLGILALLVLMTFATAAVVLDRSQDALRAQVTDAHEARASLIASEIEDAVGSAAQIAVATTQQAEMWEPIPASQLDENGTVPPDAESGKRLLLEHAHSSNVLLTASVILDPEGRVLLAEPAEVQQAFTQLPADAPVWDRLATLALDAQGADEVLLRAGPTAGTWMAAAQLTSTTREVWGVLLLIGDTQGLTAAMASAARAETNIFLVDADGILVASTAPLGDEADLDAALAGEDAAEVARIVMIGDTEHLTTVRPLGGVPWRIVVATDTEVAFASASDLVRSVLLVSGFIVLVGVAVAFLLAQSLSAPVVRLRKAAERVAAGRYGTQVRLTTNDELADLTAAFNTMSTRLLEEQQRLRRQQETLEATVQDRTQELAEKNDELEAFAFAASHDLRTPLIALDWLLQEAKEQLEQGATLEDVQATFARMEANVAGMDRLIEDLLELSRVGRTEGEPGPVPLRPILDRVLDRVAAHRKERGTKIHAGLDDDVVVIADPRRMEQLFVNVLTNAIKYGQSGGNVWIRATPIGTPRRPWKWRIEVADDGPGVPEEQREEIFMLFRRGESAIDSTTEGTGVGLALTRKIVRAYGGEIKVTSAHEGGALFWFTLTAARSGGRGAAIQNATATAQQEPGDETQGAAPVPRPTMHGARPDEPR